MGNGRPIIKYRDMYAKTAEPIEIRDVVWAAGSGWPKESRIRWGSWSANGKGQYLGKGAPNVKYRDFLP